MRDAECLIIDCFGLLSSIYRYADVTYVGGGFGVGIHNVLEAAVWDKPVIFGPNNKHFQEALGLIKAGGGFEIKDYGEFTAVNYHRWDICRDAVKKGQELNLPVYRFLKEPLIRRFGEDWYNELCEVARLKRTRR